MTRTHSSVAPVSNWASQKPKDALDVKKKVHKDESAQHNFATAAEVMCFCCGNSILYRIQTCDFCSGDNITLRTFQLRSVIIASPTH